MALVWQLRDPQSMPDELDDTCELRWWVPTWRDALRLMGWRWLIAVPTASAVALGLLMVFRTDFPGALWFWGLKLIALAIATPATILCALMPTALRNLREPFCIHCGYTLRGLPDHHRCPECGEAYTFSQIDEYRQNPYAFIERYDRRLMRETEQSDQR